MNWSHVPPEVAAALGHYVYLLRDPRDGTAFYVGKGIGNRVHAHAIEAERVGGRAKLDRIRAIHVGGYDVEHLIVRSGLSSEHEAFVVEQAVIDALTASGSALTNVVRGHDSELHGLSTVDAAIARYGAPPSPDFPDNTIVVIINRGWRPDMRPNEVYETTRGHWLLGEPTRRRAHYAFGVARGVIRGAYVIQSWFPSEQPGEGNRWGFIGTEDPDIQHYVGTSVRHLFQDKGAQNPIRKFFE